MRRFVSGRLRTLVVHSLQNKQQIRPQQQQQSSLFLSRFLSSTPVLDFASSMADKSSSPVTVGNINPKVWAFFSTGFLISAKGCIFYLVKNLLGTSFSVWLISQLWQHEYQALSFFLFWVFVFLLKFAFFFGDSVLIHMWLIGSLLATLISRFEVFSFLGFWFLWWKICCLHESLCGWLIQFCLYTWSTVLWYDVSASGLGLILFIVLYPGVTIRIILDILKHNGSFRMLELSYLPKK